MANGKDLKQAEVTLVSFGGKMRPLTFDFNALCELQEDFIDPFVAVAGLSTGDVKCMRSLLYASLVAGQMAKDETVEFDMTRGQVGRSLGLLLINDNDRYEKIFKHILEGVKLFFPDPEDKDEDEKEGSDEGDGDDDPKEEKETR